MYLASDYVVSAADNLPSGVDGVCLHQEPRRARLSPGSSIDDSPTTWVLSLMPRASLPTSPGSVPRSVITPFRQRNASAVAPARGGGRNTHPPPSFFFSLS